MDQKEYRSNIVERSEEQGNRPQTKNHHGHIHIVQAGDNLYAISRKYHVEIKDLIVSNPYVNLYSMGIGEEIFIPITKTH